MPQSPVGTDAMVIPTTAFRLNALAAAAALGDPSGQDIQRYLERHPNETTLDDINHGRLYPHLDALVEDGLLEKGTHDKRTNSYSITDDGRSLLAERVELLEGSV